ncbi:MAG: P27 family phage terminase small subunit [Oleispira sp.]|nr:P27 family phage terminase small subunit [Oleispira sp.]
MSDKISAQIIPLEPRLSAPQNQSSSSAQGDDDLYQGVVAGLPKKPKGLKKPAADLWDSMGQKLVDMGILSEIDLSVFHRYVVSYIEWQHWNTECQKDRGMASITTFATGARQMSVEAILRKQAAEQLAKLEQQLGMTPRARQAIKLENPNQGSLDL